MSTLSSISSVAKPVTIITSVSENIEEEMRKDHFTNVLGTFVIAFISSLTLAFSLEIGLLGGAVMVGAVTAVFTYLVTSYSAQKHAMSTIKKFTRLTSKEEAELKSSIKRMARFPHGQYLKLKTIPVIENANSYNDEDRYFLRPAEQATHNLERGLVFTPSGIFLKKTVTPNVNKVWDDALEAVKKVHFP